MEEESEGPETKAEILATNQKLEKLANIELVPTDKRITILKDSYRELTSLLAQVMKKDVDFGKIPGVSKESLFKPGAEKIRMLFGFSMKMERTDRILEKGLVYFTYKCTILNNQGMIIGECEGSCNSKETKYRYSQIKVPDQTDINYIQKLKNEGRAVKKEFGQKIEWYERVEKQDCYDIVNTIQKMAQKRAFVGAIVIASGTSEYYTQDMEDFREQFTEQPSN